MAKAAANLEIFALVLQGALKNKEGKEEKEEEVERLAKRPLRCWKRMAIKAWPKGDRKALCHRFSNARSGFKELEAERHWGEVAQVIQSTV